MDTPAVEKQRGSTRAIADIIKLGTKIKPEEMAMITEKAEAAGGSLVALEPDGDWCGTGRIHFPWPPKKSDDFIAFLDILVRLRINHEVLINGIPAPHEILVNVRRFQFASRR